jgi:hypothetical protein
MPGEIIAHQKRKRGRNVLNHQAVDERFGSIEATPTGGLREANAASLSKLKPKLVNIEREAGTRGAGDADGQQTKQSRQLGAQPRLLSKQRAPDSNEQLRAEVEGLKLQIEVQEPDRQWLSQVKELRPQINWSVPVKTSVIAFKRPSRLSQP